MKKNRLRQRQAARPERLKRVQARPAQPFSRQPRRHISVRAHVWKLAGVVVMAGLLLWAVAFGHLDQQIVYQGDGGSEQLQQFATTYFQETSQLRFTFDELSFQRYLERRAPFLENVSVNLPLFSRQVEVTAAVPKPVLIWQSEGTQYALNSSGYITEVVDSDSDQPLPVVFDEAGLDYRVGQKVVPAAFVDFTLQLAAVVGREGHQFTAQAFVIDQSAQSLTITTADYDIYVSTALAPEAQVETVNDLLTQLSQQGRARPGDYIDTRVAGRVFWQ